MENRPLKLWGIKFKGKKKIYFSTEYKSSVLKVQRLFKWKQNRMKRICIVYSTMKQLSTCSLWFTVNRQLWQAEIKAKLLNTFHSSSSAHAWRCTGVLPNLFPYRRTDQNSLTHVNFPVPLLFFPLPHVDSTSSWSLSPICSEKHKGKPVSFSSAGAAADNQGVGKWKMTI